MPLDDDHRDWLTLALVPGVGTANFVRLLARFRTPRNVLQASEADWQIERSVLKYCSRRREFLVF